MQGIFKVQNKTVGIGSNKSITTTNVNGLILQMNTKIIRSLKKKIQLWDIYKGIWKRVDTCITESPCCTCETYC